MERDEYILLSGQSRTTRTFVTVMANSIKYHFQFVNREIGRRASINWSVCAAVTPLIIHLIAQSKQLYSSSWNSVNLKYIIAERFRSSWSQTAQWWNFVNNWTVRAYIEMSWSMLLLGREEGVNFLWPTRFLLGFSSHAHYQLVTHKEKLRFRRVNYFLIKFSIPHQLCRLWCHPAPIFCFFPPSGFHGLAAALRFFFFFCL